MHLSWTVKAFRRHSQMQYTKAQSLRFSRNRDLLQSPAVQGPCTIKVLPQRWWKRETWCTHWPRFAVLITLFANNGPLRYDEKMNIVVRPSTRYKFIVPSCLSANNPSCPANANHQVGSLATPFDLDKRQTIGACYLPDRHRFKSPAVSALASPMLATIEVCYTILLRCLTHPWDTQCEACELQRRVGECWIR